MGKKKKKKLRDIVIKSDYLDELTAKASLLDEIFETPPGAKILECMFKDYRSIVEAPFPSTDVEYFEDLYDVVKSQDKEVLKLREKLEKKSVKDKKTPLPSE